MEINRLTSGWSVRLGLRDSPQIGCDIQKRFARTHAKTRTPHTVSGCCQMLGWQGLHEPGLARANGMTAVVKFCWQNGDCEHLLLFAKIYPHCLANQITKLPTWRFEKKNVQHNF